MQYTMDTGVKIPWVGGQNTIDRGSKYTPASSTAKTGRHDIDEILLKVALKHKQSN
jgi:hypothetical protein